MHRINLEKYEVRTDMAADVVGENNVTKRYNKDGVKVSWTEIKNNEFNKNNGIYITLEFDDITDTDYRKKVSNVFFNELKSILGYISYSKNMKTCVVGLGNEKSTPDSLGKSVVDKILVTNHLFDLDVNVDDNYSKVFSFAPGVTGQTGIETLDYIEAIVKKEKPDLVIVIDSLSSNSISRINRSIQITNSGIAPGSGVGNKRKYISSDTLGIPVIAVGVPTVATSSVIVADTINYMFQNYSYNKEFSKKRASKLAINSFFKPNKNINVSKEDKKTLLGLVGLLSYDEITNLVNEVLTPIGYNLMVTPKEIDFVISKLSEIISYGINNCLHKL